MAFTTSSRDSPSVDVISWTHSSTTYSSRPLHPASLASAINDTTTPARRGSAHARRSSTDSDAAMALAPSPERASSSTLHLPVAPCAPSHGTASGGPRGAARRHDERLEEEDEPHGTPREAQVPQGSSPHDRCHRTDDDRQLEEGDGQREPLVPDVVPGGDRRRFVAPPLERLGLAPDLRLLRRVPRHLLVVGGREGPGSGGCALPEHVALDLEDVALDPLGLVEVPLVCGLVLVDGRLVELRQRVVRRPSGEHAAVSRERGETGRGQRHRGGEPLPVGLFRHFHPSLDRQSLFHRTLRHAVFVATRGHSCAHVVGEYVPSHTPRHRWKSTTARYRRYPHTRLAGPPRSTPDAATSGLAATTRPSRRTVRAPRIWPRLTGATSGPPRRADTSKVGCVPRLTRTSTGRGVVTGTVPARPP